jgi:hypothetical protein
MRFVHVVYSHATEVVLLLKLGGNEVFFDINQQKNLWVLHNLPARLGTENRFSKPLYVIYFSFLKNKVPTFSSVSFVCSSEIKTTNDDRMIAGL